MAKGGILIWLNSDDLFLPGAISAGVEGFSGAPGAGAVYGKGYLIDKDGQISGPFPCSEPPNLWKLVHLSDYILQQSLYLRKDVLDEVGYLDEDLHYAMDWDLLIRIGSRYPLAYVDRYMGCLREYAEAKSFAGGAPRVREIASVLRRHTGRRIPPGYIVYGLDTYHKIWRSRIEERTPPALQGVSRKLQALITLGTGYIIGRTIHHSQGLYGDGWAGRKLRYMLPPGHGSLVLEGSLPEWPAFKGQTLRIDCNGRRLGKFRVPQGDFSLEIEVPAELQGARLDLTVRASRWLVPARFRLRGDRRRLAYRFERLAWSEAVETGMGAAHRLTAV
jgi:hypothetical protein